MEKWVSGKGEVAFSRLGFGCWQLGGHGWQGIEETDILNAIDMALELGINLFDTADIYGLGVSETLLSEALARNVKGAEAFVATKFGVRTGNKGTYYDNSRAWMEQALDASLKRLRRETIDLYQLHWHDGLRPIAEIFEDLEAFRKAGKIRFFGVCNLPAEQLISAPGLLSVSAEYSLLQTPPHSAAWAAQQGTCFIAWGALAQGLLAGCYTSESRFADSDVRARQGSIFTKEKWHAYIPLLASLKDIAEKYEKTMAQTALRFVLDDMPHAVTLAGIKNKQQLKDNLGAIGWKLADADMQILRANSLACQQRLQGEAAC